MTELTIINVKVECQQDTCVNKNVELDVLVCIPDGEVVCGGCMQKLEYVIPK